MRQVCEDEVKPCFHLSLLFLECQVWQILITCLVSRFGLALLKALSELQGKLHEVVFPLLILHGDDDRLCDISGSDLLHTMSTSKDKTYSVSSSQHYIINIYL